MALNILYAEQPRSNLTTSMPEAEQIEAAFRTAVQGYGMLIGPRARITRAAQFGYTENRYTYASWLVQFDLEDQTVVDATADVLRTRLNRELGGAIGTGDWTVRVLPYDPATNGDIDFWVNGTAGDTATRRQTDLNQQIGDATTVENASGPTSAEQRARSIRSGAFGGDLLDGILTALKWGTVLTVVVLGAVYLGPALSATSDAYASRVRPSRGQLARPNPRKPHVRKPKKKTKRKTRRTRKGR